MARPVRHCSDHALFSREGSLTHIFTPKYANVHALACLPMPRRVQRSLPKQAVPAFLQRLWRSPWQMPSRHMPSPTCGALAGRQGGLGLSLSSFRPSIIFGGVVMAIFSLTYYPAYQRRVGPLNACKARPAHGLQRSPRWRARRLCSAQAGRSVPAQACLQGAASLSCRSCKKSLAQQLLPLFEGGKVWPMLGSRDSAWRPTCCSRLTSADSVAVMAHCCRVSAAEHHSLSSVLRD